MLKVTRLADYAVSIIYSFSGSEKEILSSQDIIEKTKLHKATVNKLLAQLVKKNFLEPSSYISANSIIGIYEIGLYLQKSITIKELKERVLIRTRQYSKRQYTWQRGQMKDWKVFDDINYLDLRKKILSYLSKT